MVGAKLVLPGPQLDGQSLYQLFEDEGVTLSAGVPTVWQGLLTHVQTHHLKFTSMRRTVVGGSSCPPAMMRIFEDVYDVQVIHAWGMTELSPVGTIGVLKKNQLDWPLDKRREVQAKQGRAVYGVDLKIVDEAGEELPWDGKTSGELLVRGGWVVAHYLGAETPSPLRQDSRGRDWFPTGDVATMDEHGFMNITDRSKDVIKSGGEWIGSIDLENIAMAHPTVAMAACIAAKHPKWDERPLLIVVLKPEATLTREALLSFFEGRIAKWWTPDDVVFVDSIPLGPTGKMLKHQLRERFQNHLLTT